MHQLREIGQFLEHLADAIVLVNADSDIVFANQACHRLFKYGQGELTGKTLNTLIAQPMPDGRHERLVRQFIERRSEAKPMMIRGSMLCRDARGRAFSAKISISTVELGGTPYGVAVIQDFTPVQNELDSLASASLEDALTGLYNRRYFHQLVDLERGPISHWNRIGVCYLDLDEFKPVNDRHGHKAGDRVLTEIARRLRERLRNEDLAIRMGGDEFLVVLDLSGRKPREQVLQQVTKELLAEIERPVEIYAGSVRVRASAGCGIYPDHCDSLVDLVHQADQAMYQAKTGRKGIVFVDQIQA